MNTRVALILSVALSTAAGTATAYDGTITFSGTITDTTCSIAVDGGTADATVTLPTVSASTLSAAGETAGATPFSIALSGCTGTTLNTASTWFESGTLVDADTGRLINNGTATNVDVQLLNSAQGVINAGGSSQNDVAVDISSGSGTLNYYAQYYATAASTAGSVTTSVNYTIVYE